MPMIRVSYELKECLENLKRKMGKKSLDEVISQQIFGCDVDSDLGIKFTTKIVPPIEIIESVEDIPILPHNERINIPGHDCIYVVFKVNELKDIPNMWLMLTLRKSIYTIMSKSKEYSVNPPIFVFRNDVDTVFVCSFFPKDSKINKQ